MKTKPRQSKPSVPSAASEELSPKTTRPSADERREKLPTDEGKRKGAHKFDAFPDRVDIRDWFYQPRLTPLPDQIVNCDSVPFILDQGQEGACTGFALGAVINYLLAARNLRRQVSPRMIYDMARRYDEWPGEAYEGSSARGAMKGWVAHGVCAAQSWPADLHGAEHLSYEIAEEAAGTPGGAYYRVMHRNVRDMHSALNEVGILYVTLMVHDGWFEPGGEPLDVTYVESGNLRARSLPVIQRKGRATSGHAIAIVGYTQTGFIIQNSWGPTWGAEGFALLPYEDYMLHATDVWVAQLGVPIKLNTWELSDSSATAGMARATRVVPLNEIRPYVIDIGNNGQLSRSGHYWTTEADLDRLFMDIIPADTANWKKRRVMVYLHGGLNDEEAVARRIVAFRDVLLANEIYPLHIMWETGVKESINGMIRDLFTDADDRAGSWFSKLRDGLIEAKDRSFELTTAALGSALWNEMKENANLASKHPDGIGGMQLFSKSVKNAMKNLDPVAKKQWEVHVVGHSAGSIFAAHALPRILELGVTFASLQFLAPAITIELFESLMLPLIKRGDCPQPTLYLLSDEGELDDDVGPYGKSLLYLVSNAFEAKRGTPLLGMERFVRKDPVRKLNEASPAVDTMVRNKVNGCPGLVIAGKDEGPASCSRSESHGGFDNDPNTLNSVMRRILGLKDDQPLAREFQVRDLQY